MQVRKRHRLAIVISHPIQYHAPMYTRIARDGRFELKVFFMSDRGARAYHDKFAGTLIKYDNPILEGYSYEFLKQGEPKTAWQQRTEFWSPSLARKLIEYGPDAVYFHGYTNSSFWPAMQACHRGGIAVLLRGENEDLLPRPLWKRVIRELFLKILLTRVDAILYIGELNRQFFLRRGWPVERLFYVPYSVDNKYFRAGFSEEQVAEMRERVRQRHNLPRDARLFIYTHKLRDTMRPLDAVRAFVNAIPRIPASAALIMCGDGDLKKAAEEVATSAPPGRVFFTGYLSQNDLREHMLASDVMVNPAIEPWGCSVNEGIASGLAQISSDMVAGWPDMVKEQVNGWVYSSGDLEALAAVIVNAATIGLDQLRAMKDGSLALSRILSFDTCADGLAQAMASQV